MKYKIYYDIIKSGLVGAIALIGLCYFLISISLWTNIPIITHYAVSKTETSPKEVFIVIGGIGFILGLVLRARFPIIQRGVLPLAIALIMLVVPFWFGTWFIHKAAMQVEYPPQELKLADCTNNVVNFHLTAPRGHDHQLQLRMSGMTVSPTGSYNFSGRLHILSNEGLIADLSIGSDKAWLTPVGYILTGVGMQNTNVPPLSKFIQSQKGYDFEITLDSKPPTNASIWIEWWESKIDK
jgi:hypothetical protein